MPDHLFEHEVELDRYVRVHGPDEVRADRLSQLRVYPKVVLLGQPGDGKSAVLRQEEKRTGAQLSSVRETLAFPSDYIEGRQLIDALDEFRTDGAPDDKVYQLARFLREHEVEEWWLTCRAEDWRMASDIRALSKAAENHTIVVAELMPLDRDQATAILQADRCADPDRFYTKAEALGAQAFLQNPLNVRLLFKAVRNGNAWPTTRFELFNRAVARMSEEHNELRQRSGRTTPVEILRAASEVAVLALVCSANGVWRGNGTPPDGTWITADTAGIDQATFDHMLDTALFRGEGRQFAFTHRTVAEFLTGGRLCDRVAGRDETPAVPMSRTLAMISAPDGSAPSELRGLYAWFAAHLSCAGRRDLLEPLLATDPLGLLLYGDAQSLDVEVRKELFDALGRDDPYFMQSADNETLGYLASEDMADTLERALAGPADHSHKRVAAFEALTHGRPVESLRDRLRGIVLDPAREGWERWRALEAFLNGNDGDAQRRDLLDALADENPSIAREEVRVRLITGLSEIGTADLKSLIKDLTRCASDNTVGRTYFLERRLLAENRTDLFEEPVSNWLDPQRLLAIGSDAADLLDHALAGVIADPSNDGRRVWNCIVHASPHDEMPSLSEHAKKAFRERIEEVTFLEQMAEAAVSSASSEEGYWMTGVRLGGLGVPIDFTKLVPHALKAGREANDPTMQTHWLDLAMIDVHVGPDRGRFDKLHELLNEQSDLKTLFHALTRCDVPEFRLKRARRSNEHARKASETFEHNVTVLRPDLKRIRTGQSVGHLAWAAEHYTARSGAQGKRGRGRLLELVSKDIVDAFEVGFVAYTQRKGRDIEPEQLARGIAESSYLKSYLIVLAALEMWVREGQLADVDPPIEVALLVLVLGWHLHDDTYRKAAEHWAVQRLARDVAWSTDSLQIIWGAATKRGRSSPEGLYTLDEHDGSELTATALERFLVVQPDLDADALKATLPIARKRMGVVRFLALTGSVIERLTPSGDAHAAWLIHAFEVDPAAWSDQLKASVTADQIVDCLERSRFRREDAVARDGDAEVRFAWTVLDVVASTYAPAERRSGAVTTEMHAHDLVREAITMLQSSMTPKAGTALDELIASTDHETWRPALRHARAQRNAAVRDHAFKHPTIAQARNLLANRAPANAADLLAVVLDVLDRLRRELRTGNTSPWKRFWNTDRYGKAETPKIENQARDALLDRLHDRLQPYDIAATLPEAQMADESRADILVLSYEGRTLPIEAKRHYHPDLWTAPRDQLEPYMQSAGSDGMGIYLVFWFGTDVDNTPTRPGGVRPNSADELQAVLQQHVAAMDLSGVRIIVLDVSRS